MKPNSIDAYESNAEHFLQHRDQSVVGTKVVERWARSLKPGTSVIEIACGGGIPISQTLLAAGLNLRAIDSSPSLVKAFRDRFPEVPVQCATVLESDYFGLRFDAAISIGLIFLLDESDQIRMLGRVAKILRPGAGFLFTAPVEIGEWIDQGTGHPCVSLGRDTYESALADSGFRVVTCHVDVGQNNYYEVERLDA